MRACVLAKAKVEPSSRLIAGRSIADSDGPLFRPLKHNDKQGEQRRAMDPDAIDRVVRKYAFTLGLDRGYSAHSMRATFITTAMPVPGSIAKSSPAGADCASQCASR